MQKPSVYTRDGEGGAVDGYRALFARHAYRGMAFAPHYTCDEVVTR